MAEYTRQGLERLYQIVVYAQQRNPDFQNPRTGEPSDRALARACGSNAPSIGRIKENYLTLGRAGHKDFDDATLAKLAQFEGQDILWMPLSEGTDWVTGDQLIRIGFTFQDLRAIAEGSAICRIHEGEPQSPFTAELERCRGKRKHSYKQMCEYCFLPQDADTIKRIRKLLLFGGWGSDLRQATQDVLALGRYLADLDDAKPDEQGSRIYQAIKRLVELQAQSLNQFALLQMA